MDGLLLLALIIIGNLCLYWVLFGQKKFEKQFKVKDEVELSEKNLYLKD